MRGARLSHALQFRLAENCVREGKESMGAENPGRRLEDSPWPWAITSSSLRDFGLRWRGWGFDRALRVRFAGGSRRGWNPPSPKVRRTGRGVSQAGFPVRAGLSCYSNEGPLCIVLACPAGDHFRGHERHLSRLC